MFRASFILAGLVLGFVTLAHADATTKDSSNFALLINRLREGTPAKPAWAGYWFPYTADGTAAPRGGGWSPVGKYELVTGTHGAEDWEIAHHGRDVPGVQGWWGHDEGFA